MPENDKENVNSSTPNIPTDSDNVSPPPTSESVTPTIPNANLNNSLEVYRDPKLDDLLHPRLNISPTPGTHNKNDELSDLHKMDNGDDTLSSVNDLSTVSVTDNLPNLLDYLDADDLLDLPGLDPFGNQPNTITSRGAMVLATLARDVIKVRLEEINQKSVVKVKDAALQTDCASLLSSPRLLSRIPVVVRTCPDYQVNPDLHAFLVKLPVECQAYANLLRTDLEETLSTVATFVHNFANVLKVCQRMNPTFIDLYNQCLRLYELIESMEKKSFSYHFDWYNCRKLVLPEFPKDVTPAVDIELLKKQPKSKNKAKNKDKTKSQLEDLPRIPPRSMFIEIFDNSRFISKRKGTGSGSDSDNAISYVPYFTVSSFPDSSPEKLNTKSQLTKKYNISEVPLSQMISEYRQGNSSKRDAESESGDSDSEVSDGNTKDAYSSSDDSVVKKPVRKRPRVEYRKSASHREEKDCRKKKEEKIEIKVCAETPCPYFQIATEGSNYTRHCDTYHAKKNDGSAYIRKSVSLKELEEREENWEDFKAACHREKKKYKPRDWRTKKFKAYQKLIKRFAFEPSESARK